MAKIRPTKKQLEILNFIENFIDGNGYGPSYREIMKGLGYKSVSTVANHVDNLIERGHLRKGGEHSARSLELVKSTQDEVGVAGGTVSARAVVNGPDKTITLIDNLFVLIEQKDIRYPEDMNKLTTLVHALEIIGHEKAKSYKSRLLLLSSNIR